MQWFNSMLKLGKWWWPFLKKYEKWVHRKADLNLFKTTEDQQTAIKEFGLNAGQCMVIPYGIERPVMNENATQLVRERHKINSREKILLFAGTLDYLPNAEAVRHIYENLVPALSHTSLPYRIIICGRNEEYKLLNKLSHPAIINAGMVTDIENYFQAADVFINPVMTGGGIQTKNIEAISCHCPVVCFDNMTAGIPAEVCGTKLLLADMNNWDKFTQRITEAVHHKEETPNVFFGYFNWDTILKPLVKRIKEQPSIETTALS